MKPDMKDAANHRQPRWPLMGYAPGDYMGRCNNCNEQFFGLDKRAFHCLPCAVDLANGRAKDVAESLRLERAQNETLRAAIRIVQAPAGRAALQEGKE